MCAVLHGNLATRRTHRVEVGVSTPRGRRYDTLALGSGRTTRRGAVSAGVHTSGAKGQHNVAHAGQTSLGCAMPATGRPKMVGRRCCRAHGWPALGGRGQCRPGMSQSGGSVATRTSVSVCVCVCVLVCLCCKTGGGRHEAGMQSFGWQGAVYLVPPLTHVCVAIQQARLPMPVPYLAQHSSRSLTQSLSLGVGGRGGWYRECGRIPKPAPTSPPPPTPPGQPVPSSPHPTHVHEGKIVKNPFLWRGLLAPSLTLSCHKKLIHIGGPGQEALGFDLTPGERVGTSESGIGEIHECNTPVDVQQRQ